VLCLIKLQNDAPQVCELNSSHCGPYLELTILVSCLIFTQFEHKKLGSISDMHTTNALKILHSFVWSLKQTLACNGILPLELTKVESV